MSNQTDRLELPHIIHRPDLQGRFRRNFMAVFSVVGWAVWLYLFAPLITLLGWLFGYERFHDYALTNAEYTTFTVVIYATIIAAAGATLLFWAIYNLLRFRGKDRRARLSPVTTEELAQAFRITPAETVTLHSARRVVLYHDENGQISGMDTTAPGAESH